MSIAYTNINGGMPMIGADYELIYEFDGGAVYWISWYAGDKVEGKMITVYEKDIEGEDDS
jgi:hypothetical protein